MKSSLIMFENLNDGDIALLIKASQKIILNSGDTIVEYGQSYMGVFIILEGQCKVMTDTGIQLDILDAGDILGEVSYIEGRTTLARVVSIGNLSAAFIECSVLDALIAREVFFASRFYLGVARVLAYRLRLNMQAIISKNTNIFDSSAELKNELDLTHLDSLTVAGARLSYFINAMK